ncbi:MAG: GGDEF domain-containing protein [Cyanobacteria bacterium P01_A01_bin.135]
MLETQRFSNFDAAVEASLAFLHERFGFALWIVTQVEGDRMVVLGAKDRGYGIKAGDVLSWSDSFCMRMAAGDGPHYAPDIDEVLTYRSAPIYQQLEVGSYIGYPIYFPNGELFGTLCGVHPTAQSASAEAAGVQCAELTAMLLGLVLSSEHTAIQASHVAKQAEAVALSDALTSLYNRRGWNQMLSQTELHSQQTQQVTCIIAVDLDGMKRINDTQGHAQGDDVLRRAGQAIRSAVRQQDVVARVGGDEFAVLCRDCDRLLGTALLRRIAAALRQSAVDASIGVAVSEVGQPLHLVWEEADRRMYSRKRHRKLSRRLSEHPAEFTHPRR